MLGLSNSYYEQKKYFSAVRFPAIGQQLAIDIKTGGVGGHGRGARGGSKVLTPPFHVKVGGGVGENVGALQGAIGG